MAKEIITIGYDVPGFSDFYHEFSSAQSLLDADIVVFSPSIPSVYRYGSDSFQGKTLLGESGSFQLKDKSSRWKADLATALNDGKTVFVILEKYEQVFVATGQSTFSGTGRNARKTNHVDSYDNLQCLPIGLPVIVGQSGSSITFLSNPTFALLWKEFGEHMNYELYFDGPIGDTLCTTKVGSKTVGAVIKVGKGHLVLLPKLKNDQKGFTSEKDDGTEIWTKKALQFGQRLVQVLVEIDKSLRAVGEETPAPAWASSKIFALQREKALRSDIAKVNEDIEKLTARNTELHEQLSDVGLLRALLYEKGKRLEAAIIRGLEALGFSAEEYDDGSMQLDQVIQSPEGDRFIGEAEGKDSTAINIEKFRQLANNLQEDLEREEVSTPAKGILFGNPYRLTEPDKRPQGFTDKCLANAQRSGTALILTPDLFSAAKYVIENSDASYAEAARRSISSAVGVVSFPKIPE